MLTKHILDISPSSVPATRKVPWVSSADPSQFPSYPPFPTHSLPFKEAAHFRDPPPPSILTAPPPCSSWVIRLVTIAAPGQADSLGYLM